MILYSVRPTRKFDGPKFGHEFPWPSKHPLKVKEPCLEPVKDRYFNHESTVTFSDQNGQKKSAKGTLTFGLKLNKSVYTYNIYRPKSCEILNSAV